MKHVLRLGLLVAFAVPFVLMPTFGSAADDVTASKHDFTSAGTGTIKDTGSDATECNTCHVPHHASTTVLLWNHTLSGNTLTFGAGAATSSGTDLPTDVGAAPGTSKYCLSCHDGSIAVGSVIHGTSWGTDKVAGDMIIAPSGDLDGSHPVEVPYPDQASAVYNGITSAADTTQYQASPTSVKLYGTTAGQKGIGCASCHNPHDDTNIPFLRVAEASLCQSCHIK